MLDISRLDAGVVQTAAQTFPIRDIFRRLSSNSAVMRKPGTWLCGSVVSDIGGRRASFDVESNSDSNRFVYASWKTSIARCRMTFGTCQVRGARVVFAPWKPRSEKTVIAARWFPFC